MNFEVVRTDRGALAMRDCVTGEVMHPVVGPLTEARDLYVEPSRLADKLGRREEAPLVLFDVGLGAGSNAICAWQTAARVNGRRLDMVSFDRTRDALALALQSEFAESFGFHGSLREMAEAFLEDGFVETEYGSWQFVLGDLPATLCGHGPAEIVYWDPFSPRANPELWTLSAFRELYESTSETAQVFTYSSATAVRSAMLLAGFAVGEGRAIGPGRTATIAARNVAALEKPLDQRFVDTLTRSSAPFPKDAPADAIGQVTRSMARFSVPDCHR
jgi:queuine tRNA-ribosyltransferase